MPMLDIIVSILSKAVSFLTAAMTPSGIPAAQVKNITIDVNRIVFGILSFNLTATFSPAEVYPKSPLTNDFAHEKY